MAGRTNLVRRRRGSSSIGYPLRSADRLRRTAIYRGSFQNQCHRASDRGMDPAATTRSTPRAIVIASFSCMSASLDEEVESWGLHVLRSAVRMPTANAHCERLIGTIRRECLDYVMSLNSAHLRRVLREWVHHYNTGCPHRSLGPGLPERTHG
jgi:integrase-like protein